MWVVGKMRGKWGCGEVGKWGSGEVGERFQETVNYNDN
jgi:hypothetical protein